MELVSATIAARAGLPAAATQQASQIAARRQSKKGADVADAQLASPVGMQRRPEQLAASV